MGHSNPNSMDTVLLTKLISAVHENMENEQFGVEDLSAIVGISRSNLHRKLKRLKGQSVSQFIREIRLKEAMEMLQNNVATASEIAYRVGFNSPTYFHRCFRAYYGYSPGDIKKGNFEDILPKSQDDQSSGKGEYVVKDVDSSIVSDELGGHRRSWRSVNFLKILVPAIFILIVVTGIIIYFFPINQPLKSMAVLPLHNFTGDPEQDYFVNGFHDELIGKLGKISTIRVISRTSSLKYANSDMTIQQIADELNVDAIIEGSVLGNQNQVRVQLQLFEVYPEERSLWTKEYEQDYSNILIIQSDVVRNIADEIQVTMTPEEQSYLANAPKVNPEAYKACLKGYFHWDRLTEHDLNLAMQYFEKALEMDPEYALAYAGISLVHIGKLQQGLESYNEVGNKTMQAANRALALDNSLSEIHSALGGLSCWVEWDYKFAESSFRRALNINPNNSQAHAYLSHVLIILNQPEEGMKHIEEALKLDPFNTLYQSLFGMALNNTRQYDRAIDILGDALKTDPRDPVALSTLRTTYHLKKMYPEALDIWKRSYEAEDNYLAVEILKNGEDQAGYEGALNNLAQSLIDQSDTSYVTPYRIATMFTRAGNRENAIIWLEKAYESHDSNMPYIGVDPIYDFLREDPRFDALIKKMNFPGGKSANASL